MPASRNHRPARVSFDLRPLEEPILHSLSNFYREEFVRCQRCLEQQREFYSSHTIDTVEKALTRVMSQLDHLCTGEDANEVVGRLLRQFNVATGLASWSDPRQVH